MCHHTLPDKRHACCLTQQSSVTAFLFAHASFRLVVFKQPNLEHAEPKICLNANQCTKRELARDDLRQGFSECFRVLARNGTLIFNWEEDQVTVSA